MRPLDREFTPSLRHGDFGPTNILCAPLSISAVIDFRTAGLGDPAVDIAAVIGPVSYGETLAELLMPTCPGVEALLERARFYAGTVCVPGGTLGSRSQRSQRVPTWHGQLCLTSNPTAVDDQSGGHVAG
jgi:hypothetical protein